MELCGRRVCVLGADGFIGTHVCAVAVAAGAEVVGVDLPARTPDAERIRASLGAGGLKVHPIDRALDEVLTRVLCGGVYDLVVHAAGTTQRGSTAAARKQCYEANLGTTMSVVAVLAGLPDAHRPPVVMLGSQLEYGVAPMPWTEDRCPQPRGAYGATRAAATQLLTGEVRAGAIAGCVLRFPIVFGPGQRADMMIPEVIVRLLSGEDVPMTAGTQRRRLVYARDAAEMLLRCGLCRDTQMPPLVNAPALPALPIREFAVTVADAVGGTGKLLPGALPSRSGEAEDAWPDTGRGEALELGALTPHADAIAETVAWYREHDWFVQRERARLGPQLA